LFFKKYKYMFAMFRNNLPQNSAKTDFCMGVGKIPYYIYNKRWQPLKEVG
jgi:hypothetical protein